MSPSPPNQPNPSAITLATLPYISRETLATLVKPPSSTTTSPSAQPTPPPSLAIIDVRDSDHIGGHIKGSTWVPSSTLSYKTPELVRTLKEKEVVVFHCALSQQRGPGAALGYLRERERLERLERLEGKEEEGGKEGESGGGAKEEDGEGKGQRVYVLKGGFTEWQEKYGGDEGLTEGWDKGVWEWGS
ncbi:Cdc25 family phosphatase Ibp1 [Pyrenophora seminiperda CCB06]|uniref:Cdc25 family phosphatase Ibp1 n=1 Tax=Pyrenophora seminiperda CCB06 TaxID=1302712 RepID=A0A3M7MGS7_9PLEO|nr:Cdc25 family phosphatase Ibp1 [Pyrenophora seminiperda CCB06]